MEKKIKNERLTASTSGPVCQAQGEQFQKTGWPQDPSKFN